MTDCKNCKYTDEYCASGDCTAQNDLTEQYKHGNLLDDRLYYYRFKGETEVQITTQYGLYCEEADNKKEIEVIDFVPSYEEWKDADNCMLENEVLRLKNARLKDLIQDCQDTFVELLNGYYYGIAGDISREMLNKIDEVLNA